MNELVIVKTQAIAISDDTKAPIASSVSENTMRE